MLFLDLDDFKKVNDSLGHAEGDRLLVAAAERFLACGRATDTVARLGGDEFGILIEDVRGAEGSAVLIERLTEAMHAPFHLGHNEVHVTASFGIATAVGDETADDLLRNADLAMYTAKRQGKGRFATYESRMVADVRQRLEMEAALRTAIEREELVLHYQPIVHLRTGKIFGFEALVRWNHPRFGHLLPQHFVPLAEETGLIVRLGGWVLREACAQMQRWHQAYPDAQWTMSVNLSGRQLQEPELVHETRAALAMTGIDPSLLVLEITESVLMQQADSALQQLRAMKGLGVRSRHRRLRDRLFLAELPAAVPDRHPEDRQALHRRRRGRRGEVGARPGHHRAGGHAEAQDHRRGRRDRRAAGGAPHAGL